MFIGTLRLSFFSGLLEACCPSGSNGLCTVQPTRPSISIQGSRGQRGRGEQTTNETGELVASRRAVLCRITSHRIAYLVCSFARWPARFLRLLRLVRSLGRPFARFLLFPTYRPLGQGQPAAKPSRASPAHPILPYLPDWEPTIQGKHLSRWTYYLRPPFPAGK